MAVVIEQNIDAKMRDGTVLRADVYRPSEEGTYPVLVQRTPYNKEFWPFTAATFDPRRAASSGYVVVIQDVRGRWASDGDEFVPYLNEMDDGADTVEWAAKLPWSDGKVGAYGISYMGGSAWQAAFAAPSPLKAISPWTSAYSWDVHMWRGGALMLGLLASWSLGIGLTVLPRKKIGRPEFISEFMQLIEDIDSFDEVLRNLPVNKIAALRPDDSEFIPFVFDWMSRPPGDPIDKQILKEDLHANVTVPSLILSGWHDLTIGNDLLHYQQAKQRDQFTKLIVGPWSHANVASFMPVVGDIDFGMRASGALLDLKEDLTALQLRWFDRWLKGERNGIDEEPPVKIFVQGLNRWRDESEWPLARAEQRKLYMQRGGGLSWDVPSGGSEQAAYVYDPLDPCPTRGGTLLLPLSYPRGPVDQRPITGRSDALLFQTDVLSSDLEVTGPVSANLFAATEGKDTDWVVKLCDVYPDGRIINMCDGILRASYRTGERKLIEPGAVLEYTVDMWATSVLFKAGHRIAVIITSSDFPRYDRNPNTGEVPTEAITMKPVRQTIFMDAGRPSHVLLPVIPA